MDHVRNMHINDKNFSKFLYCPAWNIYYILSSFRKFENYSQANQAIMTKSQLSVPITLITLFTQADCQALLKNICNPISYFSKICTLYTVNHKLTYTTHPPPLVNQTLSLSLYRSYRPLAVSLSVNTLFVPPPLKNAKKLSGMAFLPVCLWIWAYLLRSLCEFWKNMVLHSFHKYCLQ